MLASEELVDKLRDKLSQLENNYYSVMCQLKITLRAKGSDLPVLEQTSLTEQGTSYVNELYRVYIMFIAASKINGYPFTQ